MNPDFDGTASDVDRTIVPDYRAGSDYKVEDAELPDARTRPRRSTRDNTRKPRKPAPSYPAEGYYERVLEFYSGLAMVVFPFEPQVAMYLVTPEMKMNPESREMEPGLTGAERCAKAWDDAAKVSPGVRRLLEGFLTVTVWGALISVHAPMVMIFLKNRTSLGEKLDPAEAMEAFLKRTTQDQDS
jgi:hypothetical protein